MRGRGVAEVADARAISGASTRVPAISPGMPPRGSVRPNRPAGKEPRAGRCLVLASEAVRFRYSNSSPEVIRLNRAPVHQPGWAGKGDSDGRTALSAVRLTR